MLAGDDHRRLGQRLALFHQQEQAPGMVFWHPRGLQLYELLAQAVRRQLKREGYKEVRTPQLMRRAIWMESGHWESFSEGIFKLGQDEQESALKPVSCPGHAQIFNQLNPSYRELPLKLAELGSVHRDEPSGSLYGLLRLRQFTQDDGHIFCAPEDVVAQLAAFCRGLLSFYSGFGFEQVAVARSLRPEVRFGDDALWDKAEQQLLDGALAAGIEPVDQPGEGAFYGPKLEFKLIDRYGRSWQCGTIQLDFVLPERFGLRYHSQAGHPERPVMLHRALYGSLERFMGLLLEHYQGALPGWLAPDQLVVLPMSDGQADYAQQVMQELEAAGLRGYIDARQESLSKRLVRAHELAIPHIVIVGKREQEARKITIKARHGDHQRALPLYEAIDALLKLCAHP